MFSFLCILLGTFQFVFLLLVTGILLSLAIVSRLMEIVITLVHPTSVFFLRQSVKLFVLITILSAKTTGYVLCKIIEKLRDDVPRTEGPLEINLKHPYRAYERIAYPGVDHPYAEPFVPIVSDDEQQTPSDLPNNEGASDSKENEGASDSKENEGTSESKEGEGPSHSKEVETAVELPSES